VRAPSRPAVSIRRPARPKTRCYKATKCAAATVTVAVKRPGRMIRQGSLRLSPIDGQPEQTLRWHAHGGHILPKLSNSPFRTPPRNACHSPDVNRRTGPSESLLSRTPIPPSGRPATSTQLLLEKLRELLTQSEPEPGLPGRRPSELLSTSLPRCMSGDLWPVACDYAEYCISYLEHPLGT
jgi:hypothetical protein